MEIHQLRYFCAVARHGTFTRASEAEHVAQPSLSQQFLKLEAELGARLFDRMPRAVKLTVFGRALLPKAEQILRELDEAKGRMQEMAGEEKGDVTLGVIPTIASYLLPRILTGFSRRHSLVSVKIVEDITPTLLERMRQGSVDLAIVALPIPGDDISCRELFHERFLAVLPEKHPRAKRKTLRLADLDGEPFLLLKEGHCFRDSVIAAWREARCGRTWCSRADSLRPFWRWCRRGWACRRFRRWPSNRAGLPFRAAGRQAERAHGRPHPAAASFRNPR